MRFIRSTGVRLAVLLACSVLLLVTLCLTGCAYVSVPYPHTSIRSYPVSGRVLDEHTHAPIAGAKIFLTHHPEVACKSDQAGTFNLKQIRQWHAGKIGVAAGASDWPAGDHWDADITISHTNYTPREIAWRNLNDDIILLKKSGEPPTVRPWLTFNGNGVILQDMAAAQYLKPADIHIVEHKKDPLDTRPSKLHVGFLRRVYDPRVTAVPDVDKAGFEAFKGKGSDWEFTINYWHWSDKVNDIKDSNRVYRLDFIP